MPPLLTMRGVDKSYPGVQALLGVDLTLERGEVLALLGENGAGKSTLIKVLAGAVLPDHGDILLDGQPARIRTPLDARRAGIAIIYQEFSLVPTLTAAENLFLGRERSRLGWLSRRAEHAAARRLFERLGVAVDPDVPCGMLSVAQQQAVEIARALALEARIIVMDEPSATLTPQEVDRLLAVVRELTAQGIGVIYVSHRLEEIEALADRVTVLRDGRHVATRPRAEVDRATLIELMIGRRLDQEFPSRSVTIGEPRLVVEHLSCAHTGVRDVSLTVRRGEVLALTGLVGAGRTEVARLLFGADRADTGTITLDGQPIQVRNPRAAIRAGICLLTEDRKAQGLVLDQSVRANFALPNLTRLARLGFLSARRERRALSHYAEALRLKVPHFEVPARTLSGGNQQKLVLAKWLEANSEVLIFDEPTRGIDVGAKAEIYQLINDLARRGKAILMISSELPEVLALADRILVMHDGRVTGEIADARHATQRDVMELAVR